MSKQKLRPTEFAAEVKRLKAAGKMPSLEELLTAIADARKIYVPLILTARSRTGK